MDRGTASGLKIARTLVRLAHSEAGKRDVPSDVSAHAMLIEALILLTGQPEERVLLALDHLPIAKAEPNGATSVEATT
jgi:hypothetical protein